MKKNRYKRVIALIMFLILFQNCFYIATAEISSFYTPSTETIENFSESFVEGYSIEECVECRVIVKATSEPDTYGYAESIIENNDIYIYQYSDAETAQKAVEYYNSLPYVKWAELDGIVESQALSYGNYMMQGDEAKEYVIESNLNKEEIIVAVLDTGAVFDDPYFNGRVIDSGYNFSNTGEENSAIEQDNLHGDFVASIILDNTPENVKIYAYKVLNSSGYGSNSGISLGIDMAVADGADIINMSLGTDEFSNAVYDSIKNAYSKGVIVVCAAGNDGDDVSKYYPASFDEVFTVGSIDRNGNYSFFSNHGEEVDFVAPGHNIETMPSYEETTPIYQEYGTSFSAPFVSAAAAMVLSVNPELTIDEAKNILIESSVPYEELSYHDGFHVINDYEKNENYNFEDYFIASFNDDESLYYGYGMPQIQNAVGIALGYDDAEKPEISVESGTYHEAFEVTISAPEGYEIYYTTNENYPSKDSAIKYSSPITIQGTQSIRAVAYSPDGMRSKHNTAEYRVLFYAEENDFTIDSDGYLTSYTGNLAEFIVPETINGITVTGIRRNGLYNNDIVSVVLPETLNHIEERGLRSNNAIYISAKGLVNVEKSGILCQNVAELEAPNLEYVDCIRLGVRSIDFPKLSKIGDNAFTGNSHLKSVNLPLITEIPYLAFSGCRVLREINCPLVTTIDIGAFRNCHFLKKVNIPNVEKFTSTYYNKDYGTFEKCINLTEIEFPNVITIEDCRLFYKCYYLNKVTLPNAATIGAEAFSECYSLTEIHIPAAQTISDYAFEETHSLTEITLPKVKEMGNNVFRNSSLKTLNAPELETVGEYCFSYYDNFWSKYVVDTSFDSIYAPNLKTASDYAFAYTGELTKLELPSLTDLGENAFLESSVSYFDAPKLKNASSLPTAENSIVVLSSEFSECLLDATGYDLTIHGTYGTYAEAYANQYELTFVGVPVILLQPASIYSSTAETLETDAVGVNLTYQWYGTDSPENLNGAAVDGATNKVFDPTDFESFPYYYCIVTGTDGDYVVEIKTDIVKNSLHFYAADYTALEVVIAKIPENLSVYTDESVTALNNILNSIDRSLNIIHQKQVDGYVIALTEAIEALKLKSADYAALEAAIAKIPENLSVYTNDSVTALYDVLNSIDRSLDITQQEQVDEYVIALTEAIEVLKLKSADYTALEAAIAKIPENLSVYTNDSVTALNDVLNSIDRSLDITQQEQVDEYVIALTEAIEALKLKSADYTALEAAIAKIPANLSVYTDESVTALNDVLNSIDKSLDITQQEQVDEYVIKVNNAVATLELKSADYAELEIVIKSVPSDLSVYTDESSAELKAILAEIDKNLDITNQAEVDKWTEEIPKAVQKLILKPADYSALEKAIAAIPSDLSLYTEDSVAELQEIIDSIDYSLDITQQEQVDEYVIKVNNAVATLELKSADYAELEIVIKSVPSDLSVYTDESSAELKAILAEIDKNLDITNQAEVDKWTEEIPKAVQKLILKPADYSALEKAIAAIPSDLSLYTEDSVAELQEIIDSIDYSLDITQQEQVDEYAEQITEATNNLKEECWLIRLFKAIIAFIRKILIRVTILFV